MDLAISIIAVIGFGLLTSSIYCTFKNSSKAPWFFIIGILLCLTSFVYIILRLTEKILPVMVC